MDTKTGCYFKVNLKVIFCDHVQEQKVQVGIDRLANLRGCSALLCILIAITSFGQNRKVCFSLQDKVYETEISSYGNWGISWIDRWALSKGKKGEFFKGEPSTPEYIVELAK